MIGRRAWLGLASGVSAAGMAGTLGTWPGVAAALAGPAPDSAFGFAPDRVPMNAANLCPMPSAIGAAVARFAAELDRDMSAGNRRRVEGFKETARAGIARQLGVGADEVAVVRNTSEANGIVVQGLELAAGDEVLLWDQNHPSNHLAWRVRARRDGFTVREFPVPAHPASIDEVVDAVTAALTPGTRVVSFTHVSNVTGFRMPAAEVCAALRARAPSLFIHVDGAQTWGARAADLRAMGCDSFSGSAHKWYLGPRETGMLYVRADRQDEVAATVVSIPWGGDVTPEVTGARRYEALGQRDDAAIAALAETVAWHDALTPAAVERASSAVAERLREGVEDLGLPLVSNGHPDFRSSVVNLRAGDAARRRLPELILEDAGVIAAATGGLRFSPHVYNTPAHVDRVLAALARHRDLLG